MDYLEKFEAEQEERREAIASAAAARSASSAGDQRTRAEISETDYPVTIIGCIRGVDGWYLAGYDMRTKTIKPLRRMSGDRS